MIDEGPQLRHHLVAARIIEKYSRRHRRERLERMHQRATVVVRLNYLKKCKTIPIAAPINNSRQAVA
jgi:hypothetical protein